MCPTNVATVEANLLIPALFAQVLSNEGSTPAGRGDAGQFAALAARGGVA